MRSCLKIRKRWRCSSVFARFSPQYGRKKKGGWKGGKEGKQEEKERRQERKDYRGSTVGSRVRQTLQRLGLDLDHEQGRPRSHGLRNQVEEMQHSQVLVFGDPMETLILQDNNWRHTRLRHQFLII